MGFSHNQSLTSPTPYPLESCPFHSMLHCRSWLWFILFDVRIYMMPHHNVPDSTTYHQQLPLLLKHTHTNRWWGFCLELLTTINYNIYTSCKRGRDRGHYIPLPLRITPSSVFQYIYTIHIPLHIKISKLQIYTTFNHLL